MSLSPDPEFSSPEGKAQPTLPAVPPDGKRWSGAAITAFVLSMVGFLGFTAILGLIFAVVGVVATRGGRRRGLGLAVAAVPLSVITGVIGLYLIVMYTLFQQVPTTTRQVGSLLAPGSGVHASIVGGLLESCSEDLRQTIEAEEFVSWLGAVQSEHGSFVELARGPTLDPTLRDGILRFTADAKFVNGPATIRLTFQRDGFWRWVLSDIEIDGASPRSPP